MIKLNLGCGKDYRKDFINIDILPCLPDIVANVTDLPFKSNTIDIIMANDVFEHIPFAQSQDMLKHWYDIMKQGAYIYIKAPCLERIIQYFHEEGHKTTKGMEITIKLLFGDQDYKENTHYTTTIPALMDVYLTKAGFKEVQYRLNNTNAEYRAIK